MLRPTSSLVAPLSPARSALALALSACHKAPRRRAPAAAAPEWQLLASELPSALLSVSGALAVGRLRGGRRQGARAARAPLRRQGVERARAPGSTAISGGCRRCRNGPVLMAGANATVLRYDGKQLRAHEHARPRTADGLRRLGHRARDDFYAVGSAAGATASSGTTTAARSRTRRSRSICRASRAARSRASSRCSGRGDDVWVVGAGGHDPASQGRRAVRGRPDDDEGHALHGPRHAAIGSSPSAARATACSSTGRAAAVPRRVAAGRGAHPGSLRDATHGDWASGERGLVYARAGAGAARSPPSITGCRLPPASSLHSIFVDTARRRLVGGRQRAHAGARRRDAPPLRRPRAAGRHRRRATPAPPDAAAPPRRRVPAPRSSRRARSGSIARRWDEQALAAIRRDLPRPTVHARNLFHVSAAMWDAWAGVRHEGQGRSSSTERHTAADVDEGAPRRDQLRRVRRPRAPLPNGDRRRDRRSLASAP